MRGEGGVEGDGAGEGGEGPLEREQGAFRNQDCILFFAFYGPCHVTRPDTRARRCVFGLLSGWGQGLHFSLL